MSEKLPEELIPLFEPFRGTGVLTVGAVGEYARRWRMVRLARSLDPIGWLSECAAIAERESVVSGDRSSYIDENIGTWIDVWRRAMENEAHFSSANAAMLEKAGLLRIVERSAYNGDFGGKEMSFDIARMSDG